jgi:hypothetical protein
MSQIQGYDGRFVSREQFLRQLEARLAAATPLQGTQGRGPVFPLSTAQSAPSLSAPVVPSATFPGTMQGRVPLTVLTNPPVGQTPVFTPFQMSQGVSPSDFVRSVFAAELAGSSQPRQTMTPTGGAGASPPQSRASNPAVQNRIQQEIARQQARAADLRRLIQERQNTDMQALARDMRRVSRIFRVIRWLTRLATLTRRFSIPLAIILEIIAILFDLDNDDDRTENVLSIVTESLPVEFQLELRRPNSMWRLSQTFRNILQAMQTLWATNMLYGEVTDAVLRREIDAGRFFIGNLSQAAVRDSYLSFLLDRLNAAADYREWEIQVATLFSEGWISQAAILPLTVEATRDERGLTAPQAWQFVGSLSPTYTPDQPPAMPSGFVVGGEAVPAPGFRFNQYGLPGTDTLPGSTAIPAPVVDAQVPVPNVAIPAPAFTQPVIPSTPQGIPPASPAPSPYGTRSGYQGQ